MKNPEWTLFKMNSRSLLIAKGDFCRCNKGTYLHVDGYHINIIMVITRLVDWLLCMYINGGERTGEGGSCVCSYKDKSS